MQNIDEYISETAIPYLRPSDTDTHAMYELKMLVQNRLLTKYIYSLDVMKQDPNIEKKLWNMFLYAKSHVPKKLPNYFIFMLRNDIQPAKWYTPKNEPVPEKIKFTPKFSADVWMTKRTVGHEKLYEIMKANGHQKVADDFDVPKTQLRNVIGQRFDKITGRRIFKCFPEYHFVRAFKEVIHPDLWFIFPEELEQ